MMRCVPLIPVCMVSSGLLQKNIRAGTSVWSILKTGDFPTEDIFSLPRDRTGKAWVRRHQEWHRPQLLPVQSGPSESVPYRYGGVYVIIGGAGGIGEVWTDYMVTTYKARVVWIGRRPLDSRIRQNRPVPAIRLGSRIYSRRCF